MRKANGKNITDRQAKAPPRFFLAVVVIIFLASVTLKIILFSDPYLIEVDGYYYSDITWQFWKTGHIDQSFITSFHPLRHYIGAFLFDLFSPASKEQGILILRYFNIVLFSSLCVPAYFLGRKLYNEWLGLAGAFLISFSPAIFRSAMLTELMPFGMFFIACFVFSYLLERKYMACAFAFLAVLASEHFVLMIYFFSLYLVVMCILRYLNIVDVNKTIMHLDVMSVLGMAAGMLCIGYLGMGYYALILLPVVFSYSSFYFEAQHTFYRYASLAIFIAAIIALVFFNIIDTQHILSFFMPDNAGILESSAPGTYLDDIAFIEPYVITILFSCSIIFTLLRRKARIAPAIFLMSFCVPVFVKAMIEVKYIFHLAFSVILLLLYVCAFVFIESKQNTRTQKTIRAATCMIVVMLIAATAWNFGSVIDQNYNMPDSLIDIMHYIDNNIAPRDTLMGGSNYGHFITYFTNVETYADPASFSFDAAFFNKLLLEDDEPLVEFMNIQRSGYLLITKDLLLQINSIAKNMNSTEYFTETLSLTGKDCDLFGPGKVYISDRVNAYCIRPKDIESDYIITVSNDNSILVTLKPLGSALSNTTLMKIWYEKNDNFTLRYKNDFGKIFQLVP